MSLVWPNGSRNIPPVTSEFNPARRHPITGDIRPHRGIDIIGFHTILSPVNGVVTINQYQAGGAGHWLEIRGDNGHRFRFFHLKGRSWVPVGRRVSLGTSIGTMGMTGSATGIHLHYEIWPGGSPINPRTYYAQHLPKPKPVKPKGTAVRAHYHRADKYSREGGRVLNAGQHLYLHTSSRVNSQASNIIGGVGPYSFTTHLYATGEPGDALDITLIWQNQRVTPRRNSNHFTERVYFGPDGNIFSNREFKRGATNGDAVFARVRAADTNKKPATVTRLDTDAYLFAVA